MAETGTIIKQMTRKEWCMKALLYLAILVIGVADFAVFIIKVKN